MKKKKKCHVALVDFPKDLSFGHLKFYEAMFIILAHPKQNKEQNHEDYREHFRFLRDKKITIGETRTIREYHKP